MAIMPKIQKMLQRPQSALPVGRRRETEHTQNPHALQEDALRAMLMDDPNNERAFLALVDLVADNAVHGDEHQEFDNPGLDPLFADPEEIHQHVAHTNAELVEERRLVAMWALAEEYAGHPKGWYPMIQLARLSLETNVEDGLRRLNAGISRDDTGQALARSIELLRDSNMWQEAYSLGAGHWRARDHHPIAGVAVVRAALDCGKVLEAHAHLIELQNHYDAEQINELDPTLVKEVEQAVAEVPQGDGWIRTETNTSGETAN